MTRGVSRGWYPDYDAPPGHQRYWNGKRWTERRGPQPPPGTASGRFSAWVAGGFCAIVACLVIVSASVLVVGDDQPSSGQGFGPPPASTPRSPASRAAQVSDTDPSAQQRRAWEVTTVLDGTTFQLANGARVRLLGVTVGVGCAASGLARLVDGQAVTLTKRGPDRDAQGLLLRYAELDGVDVGMRLIQRGLASASDEDNPRRAIYRRVDDRSPDAC